MKIEFSQRALRDIREQTTFIATDKPSAAIAVANRLESSIRNLADYPELGRPGRRPGTRELPVTRTAFVVLYRVMKTKVVILRIRHAAENWR